MATKVYQRCKPNEAALQLYGVTFEDFKMWCKEHKKPMYKEETKKAFFERLNDGRLVKENGKLVRKNRRKSIWERR